MAIGVKTKIEWTDATLNVLAGCEECDPGCANCYAKNVASRMANHPNELIRQKFQPVAENGNWTGRITITEKEIVKPLRTTKSQMIFVNSLSDLFYREVPDEWIDRHVVMMFLARHHFFQVLTKRHKRLNSYFNEITAERLNDALDWLTKKFGMNEKRVAEYVETVKKQKALESGANRYFGQDLLIPTDNVIWAVSASDRRGASLRIPDLLMTKHITKRAVSLEPIIGEIDLTEIYAGDDKFFNALTDHDDEDFCLPKLDWVIAGGESSKLKKEISRPANPDWIRKLRDDCRKWNVPFFFKQWGDYQPYASAAFYDDPAAEIGGNCGTVVSLTKSAKKGMFLATFENGETADCVKITRKDWTWGRGGNLKRSFVKIGKDKAGNKLDGVQVMEFPEITFGEYVNFWKKS